MFYIKKISKIVDEITTFYLENSAKDVNVSVRIREEGVYIITSGKDPSISEDELKEIEKNINTKNREAEMEEYYWSLAGEGPSSENLSIVAVLVDTAGITYEKETNMVYINLFRKNTN